MADDVMMVNQRELVFVLWRYASTRQGTAVAQHMVTSKEMGTSQMVGGRVGEEGRSTYIYIYGIHGKSVSTAVVVDSLGYL